MHVMFFIFDLICINIANLINIFEGVYKDNENLNAFGVLLPLRSFLFHPSILESQCLGADAAHFPVLAGSYPLAPTGGRRTNPISFSGLINRALVYGV